MKHLEDTTPAYMEKTLGSKAFDVVNLIILLIVAVSCVLPIWYTFCVSISDEALVAAGDISLWPKGITLSSYEMIMGDVKFFRAFGVSIMRVFLAVTITTIVSLLMAYPLSKNPSEFSCRNHIMWLLVFCMLFNGGLVPWFQVMLKLKMIDNIWGLVLGGGLPVFNVILVMNFYRNLPRAIEEAATVDGAGPWQILLKIILPVSKPVVATIVLFVAVNHWNEFLSGLILSNSSANYPLQTYIQQMVINLNTASLSVEEYQKYATMSNQTLNAAKLFIAMMPVLVVYPFLQKYFITGITLGSVKE